MLLALHRVKQVFRFLKAFAERRVPTRRTLAEHEWSLRFADLPDHASVQIGTADITSAVSGADVTGAEGDTVLLRVSRPRLTAAPQPPERTLRWLAGIWDDPALEPQVREAMERAALDRPDSPRLERFEEEPLRVAEFANYRLRWKEWADVERPAREAMRVFERLYSVLGRIERDSERVELILGNGRLHRRTPAGSIDHPVLLQRVELEFDTRVPEFRVSDADRGAELYTPVLVDDEALSGEKCSALQRELEATGIHPLGETSTRAFLQRLAALLGPTARYGETEAGQVWDGHPTLGNDPVLFLRLRSSGLPAAFERILEDLDGEPTLPLSLTRVVGVEQPVSDPEAEGAPVPAWGEPADVLFSKDANVEQVHIARALEKHRAVLVQGPPGTGKSHTIANLVGHLVAQGKRVLVTSHTTKALRVLRGHIVEELRPLCVALLEQDLEGRVQLEAAVSGILERLTGVQESHLVEQAAMLTKARSELLETVAKLADELRLAREGEYIVIVPTIDGDGIPPADAAREIAQNQTKNGWVPGPVSPGAPLPLSLSELGELYGTNAELAQDEERELTLGLPKERDLLDGEAFAQAIAALGCHEPPNLAQFWIRPPRLDDLAAIEALRDVISVFLRDIDAMVPWQRALVVAGRQADGERTIWLRLREQVRNVIDHHSRAREILLQHDVELSGVSLTADTKTTVDAILEHVRVGKSLGALTLLTHGTWKALLTASRVDGGRPTSIRQFEAIAARLDTDERRATLARRWNKQGAPIGLPLLESIPEPIETGLGHYVEQFEHLLDWWGSRWKSVSAAFEAAGCDWAAFRNHEIERVAAGNLFERERSLLSGPLMALIKSRISATRRSEALERLAALDHALTQYSAAACRELREATRTGDVKRYKTGLSVLAALIRKQSTMARRNELLILLDRAAPAWATAIETRREAHGDASVPGDPEAAWRWRQLYQELEHRSALNEHDVTRKLRQSRAELRQTTTRLIDCKAWLAQLRRTDLTARQALIGWADTQRKIGKGTGKRVPELQARAREQLSAARDAVPVWIMPLARVAESFDPRKAKFDVVIVDEASQSDLTGLLAFYAGERVVVVGDHEQVSPSAIGHTIEDTRTLIAQHLDGIPNSHLYDGQTSIYDLARQAFGGTIALREHFRCVPDIIDFSNYLSYSGQIRPLRDRSSARQPHVAELVVASNVDATEQTSNKVNRAEARWAAALIAAMVEMPELEGSTVGAITLLGEEQAFEIQRVALQLVGAVELHGRRFGAGNPAQFQGDERDIVVLSMVDRPTGTVLRFRDDATFKQRYNVAASRARDQLWLIHSLDPVRDLQPGDLRRRLIDHVRNPGALRAAAEAATNRAESPFERLVIEGLIGAGFEVTPQVEVGGYRIDMVVSDGKSQLAVECDGDRYHPAEQIPSDLARQAVLERAGWRFVRIRGTRFFRNPESTLKAVVEEIEHLGIRRDVDSAVKGATDPDDGLKQRVVRRAAEVMREHGWIQTAQNGEASTAPDLANAAPRTSLLERAPQPTSSLAVE